MELEDVRQASLQHPLLQALSSGALERLFSGSRVLKLRAKRTLLREGESPGQAFFLLSGAVRVFHRDGDTEVLLKLFRGPALFGEMEVMTGRPYLEHVVTLEPSELLIIPAETFRFLFDTEPAFTHALARDLAARLCIAAHNIRALAFGDLRARLAHLLLDYAQLFGERYEEREGAIRIRLSLSQEMMAKDLAVSRKAVNDTLLELRAQRLIDKRDARYVLLRPEALSELSTGTLSVAHRLEHIYR